jgi:Terminase large subunit, T4likevirus-type, N-terminal
MNVNLKPPQGQVFCSDRRFRVLVAGRRFGKTFLALVELCRAAWGPDRLAWYVAPTYKQAKRIAWKRLKDLTRPYWAAKPNETDLRVDLISGGIICLRCAAMAWTFWCSMNTLRTGSVD